MANPESCRYAQSHEWALAEGEHVVVGLSDHAQQEITDVVFVELPKPGAAAFQGKAIAVVESVKAAFDIYAPVSGEIVAVNDEVAQNPAVVNESPLDKGWLFKIKASDSKELGTLMDYSQYLEFLKTNSAA